MLIPLSFEFEQYQRMRAEGFRMVHDPCDPPSSEARVRCFDTTSGEVFEFAWRGFEERRAADPLDPVEAVLVEEITAAHERAGERARQLGLARYA